ncbi:MAG: hypothetical protein FJ279_26965 [Planctomycetes bacterium]|nr:hypothetical protein [Planctomycetota bacterium]
MERIFEKTFLQGYFTHFDFVMPRHDLSRHLGGGPRYTPMKQIGAALALHPLEKRLNRFNEVVKELTEAPQERCDELLDKEANFSVPLMLALGWLDLDAPEVGWDELPPSAFFDGEGAVTMKSGWDENLTDIYFVSGLRDVCYRVQPNHFQVFKAGRALLGTAALHGDHGNPVPYWGNTVVVGNDWPEWWGQMWHPRMDERKVVNRFAPETLGYAMRDYRFGGFMPNAYGGFFRGGHGYGYYDLTLHSHTRHPFLKDGEVLAYETWPQFDYVAADAANAWPLEQVSEMVRQLVFIRPDVIVLYDRVKLGPTPGDTAWIAALPAKLNVAANTFLVGNEQARLLAEVLMPENAKVSELKLGGKYPVPGRIAFVQISPEDRRNTVEYLVLMQTGLNQVSSLSPTLQTDAHAATVSFAYGGKKISVQFNRTGDVGGRITLGDGWRAFRHDFAATIDDTYRRWKGHPLYRRWTTEPRFRFLVKD